ncbi:hypothetical protein BpHYR1_003407 [Brachionus plicatilis]|uniref:Uncharacterized protein n=1 Tax=Brachionus plicatilis TaxID=10195 RepID=A0A3M7PT94_BRAPC|nr:hypothetical protein BpHYR1_003407 [Brachionus plicatilis]
MNLMPKKYIVNYFNVKSNRNCLFTYYKFKLSKSILFHSMFYIISTINFGIDNIKNSIYICHHKIIDKFASTYSLYKQRQDSVYTKILKLVY